MVMPGRLWCLAGALALLLAVSPASQAGEPPAAPSRGEDNRTERGNEALIGEGAWTGTLMAPAVSSGAQPRSPEARTKTAAKKPRVRV